MGNILAGHVVRELLFEGSEARRLFLCTYEGIVSVIQAFIFFKLLENYLEEAMKSF
jgi:F0F1-type ATP synthase membrane subunit a